MSNGTQGPSTHLLRSLVQFGGTLLAVAQTRVELLTTEISEDLERGIRVLLWALVAVLADHDDVALRRQRNDVHPVGRLQALLSRRPHVPGQHRVLRQPADGLRGVGDQVADHCEIDLAHAVRDKLARNAETYPAKHVIARVSPAHASVPGTHVLLDYVTPRYRDFSPGEFVWRRSGLLRERGIQRVVTPPGMVGAYYDRLDQDFRRRWARQFEDEPEFAAGVVLDARRRVMVEVNVSAENLEAVIEVLPCMREPTVATLHHGAGYAVKAAVPRDHRRPPVDERRRDERVIR